jgi:hypothetical protein
MDWACFFEAYRGEEDIVSLSDDRNPPRLRRIFLPWEYRLVSLTSPDSSAPGLHRSPSSLVGRPALAPCRSSGTLFLRGGCHNYRRLPLARDEVVVRLAVHPCHGQESSPEKGVPAGLLLLREFPDALNISAFFRRLPGSAQMNSAALERQRFIARSAAWHRRGCAALFYLAGESYGKTFPAEEEKIFTLALSAAAAPLLQRLQRLLGAGEFSFEEPSAASPWGHSALALPPGPWRGALLCLVETSLSKDGFTETALTPSYHRWLRRPSARLLP